MSLSRVFSIVGDSNVKKNFSKTNARACPSMSGCQVLSCQKLELLEEALGKIRKESNVCIVSCVTNFLASSDEDSMISRRIEPVLDDFCTLLGAACVAQPQVAFLVAPPMYRQLPLWYREGLPEVLTKFSSFLKDRPSNLHLLSSFPTPDFDQDGVHLTAYSGLEFMIHLFDSSIALLDGLDSSCDQRLPMASEATRLLEDRVMVLEQDHRRLNRDVELKTAIDSELHDYNENMSNEPFLVITGCSRILGLGNKEWQERAKKEVAPILKELMGREVPIDYITNSTGPQPDALVRYNVKLFSAALSKEVRTKFGKFYTDGKDERPEFFKPYSIRNLLTQGTRIRLAVLQVIARRYKDSNQGSRTKVIGYDPRPILRITPAPGSQSRRVRTYTYVEAVQKYPTNFSKSDLDFILSKVGYKQKGRLRALFICLNDDMLPKHKRNDPAATADPSVPGQLQTESTAPMDVSESAEANLPRSDRPAEVHPPRSDDRHHSRSRPSGSGHGSSGSGSSGSGSSSGNRTQKRGAGSPATVPPEKTSRV